MVSRQFILFGAAVAVSAGVVAGDRAGVWSVGQPPPTGPHSELCAPPDDQLKQLWARTEVKEGLLRRLIAGTVRLDEVTAVYLQLHDGDATYDLVIRAHYPAPTLAAGIAQSVIWVTQSRLDDPYQRSEVLARLTAEYEAEHGPLPRHLVE